MQDAWLRAIALAWARRDVFAAAMARLAPNFTVVDEIGGQLHCHLEVLAMRLPSVFGAIMAGRLAEFESRTYTMPHELEHDAVLAFAEYLYTGATRLTVANAQSLFQTADVLVLRDLHAVAEHYLVTACVHDGSVLGLRELAFAHNSLRLARYCTLYAEVRGLLKPAGEPLAATWSSPPPAATGRAATAMLSPTRSSPPSSPSAAPSTGKAMRPSPLASSPSAGPAASGSSGGAGGGTGSVGAVPGVGGSAVVTPVKPAGGLTRSWSAVASGGKAGRSGAPATAAGTSITGSPAAVAVATVPAALPDAVPDGEGEGEDEDE